MRKSITVAGVARLDRAALLRSTALPAAALLVLALPVAVHAQPAPNARPAGGQVVAGQASIAALPSSTRIDQGSARAAIDWRGFDVGAQQSVDFHQPSASAVTLNRVTGPDPSRIAGRITANGQLVIVNQSGVTFSKGAQVETAGLVVSAAGIGNANFMSGGRLVFDQAPKPNAAVRNDGAISVGARGLAALVAPTVVNSGVITARMGHVVLAGAQAHTVDLYGDGLLSINVTKQVATLPVGPDGKPVAALVTNTGVVRADGGTVVLTAQAVDGLVQTLVAAGGTIRAGSVGAQTGTVVVSGIGGSVRVDGRIAAAGRAPGTTGGAVEVDATNTVTIGAGARIDASGRAGGGTVAIGTTLARARGGPSATPALTAAAAHVEAGARIDAGAIRAGSGGRVTVLSTGDTAMGGRIRARGGARGGDGGFVEVSGGGGFALTGTVDVGAPRGATGTILIDPRDLSIVASAGTVTTPNPAAPNVPAGSFPDGATDATIDVGTIAGLVGNIQLQATRDLTVAAPLTVTLTGGGTFFELDAGRNIAVNAALSSTNADLVLHANMASAGGGITLTANVTAPAGNTVSLIGDSLALGANTVTAGTVEVAPASAIGMTLGGTAAGTLSLPSLAGLAPSSTLRLGATTDPVAHTLTTTATAITVAGPVAAAVPTLDFQTSGAVTQSATGVLTANTLTGRAASVALATVPNLVTTLGAFTTAGNFALANAQTLTVGGAVATGIAAGTTLSIVTTAGDLLVNAPVSAPSVTLQAFGGLAIDAAVTASGASPVSVTLTAQNGDISEGAGGVVATPLLTGSARKGTSATATGRAILTQANQVTSLGAFGTDSDFSLTNAQALGVTGAVTSASGGIALRTTGGTGLTLGAALTASASGQTISLVADALTFAAGGSATAGGAVEIAPDAAIAVTLGSGGAGLNIDPTTLGVIAAPLLRIGRAQGATTATSIAITTATTSPAATLELDTTGGITQTAALGAGTLTGAAGADVVLDVSGNALPVLGAFTVTAGNFSLATKADLSIAGALSATAGTVSLATPNGDITETAAGTIAATTLTGSAHKGTSPTATGRAILDNTLGGGNRVGTLGAFATDGDFTLVNAQALVVNGPVAAGTPASGAGAPATQGAVAITATGPLTIAGDITARRTGATGITLAAQGAAGDVIQTGGTVATDGALSVTAQRNVTLSGGVLTSGGALSVSGVTITQGAHTVSAFGAITITGTGSITQNAGGFIGGTNAVTLDAPSVVQNTGGVIAAQGTATLAAAGALTIDGTLYLPSGGAATIGSTAFDTEIGGTILGGPTFAPASGLPWPGAITASGGAAFSTLTVRGDYIYLASALNAATHLTLTATHDIFEHARGNAAVTGAITTALLTGSAGTATTLGSALLTGANAVTSLGAFTTTRGLTLNNAGTLTVTGAVAAGTAGAGVAGDTRAFPPAGPGGLADEVAAQAGTAASASPRLELDAPALVVAASGSLTANSYVVGGVVTPGVVALRTDALTLPASGTAISALDGTVAIAPLTPGTAISVGGGTGLVLTQAMLARIATVGVTSGTAGTQTLALGSVDGGATLLAGSIAFTGAIDLSTIARTLQVNASGNVTSTAADSLVVRAVTGRVGGTLSLGGGPVASGAAPAGGNRIGALGAAIRSAAFQTLAGNPFAVTGLTAGGDVFVLDNGSPSQTLSVVGSVAAGAGRTIGLTAPALSIDATGFNAGQLVVQAAFAPPAGGAVTVTPGTVALRNDLLAVAGTGPEVLAPDGTVAIAPYTVGATISVGTGAATGLALSQATLAGISTLGVAGGVAGTATLALGSLDGGTHQLAGAVTVMGTADLSAVAATLQASAAGSVTSTAADSLIVGAVTGTAGGDVSLAGGGYVAGTIPTTGNRIGALGAASRRLVGGTTYQAAASYALATTGLAAGGDVRVTDNGMPGQALSVIGAITAGAGRTIALTAPSLSVDATSTGANGSLTVQAAFSAPTTLTVAGGTATGIVVTPGTIALQADAVTLTGAVSAPDGTVALAPYTAGTAISIGTGAATGLALTQATLSAINTLGVAGGVAGTQTLALGSLDGGAHPLASAITIAGTTDLSAVAHTLQVAATGDVTAGASDSLIVGAVTGRVGGTVSLGGGLFAAGTVPATGNRIGALGVARTAVGTGATYQTLAANPLAVTGLTAGGDVGVLNGAALSVVGAVSAGAGRTIALTAPGLTVDATTLLANGIADNAGQLVVQASFAPPSGGVVTVTPGTVAIRTDALTLAGAGPEVLAPDGTVAIAPYTVGNTVNLGTGAATGLALSQATLSGISTLGVAGGVAGTATLALGSLDGGAHQLAGAVTVMGTADLSAVAATLQASATGSVTSTAADSLIVGAVTGTAGGDVSLAGGGYVTGTIPATGNRVGALGAASRRLVGGTTYQAAASYALAATGLAADGDVRVTDNGVPGQALSVIGAVTAGAGRTIALTAPSLTVDSTSIGASGSLTVASVLSARSGTTTVTPGTILLQADALTASGAITAPDGTVAITTYTQSGAISLGAGSGLVLSQATLANVITLGTTTGPAGTQTLALGSLDGGAHLLAGGGIAVGASVDLSTVARTLALFSAGSVSESPTAGIVVSALTGNAASIVLPGPNAIAFVGTPATIGAFTAAGAPAAPNLHVTNDLTLTSVSPSLTVRTTLTAGGTATLTASAGDLLIPGTINAGATALAAARRIGESGAIVTGPLSATAGLSIDLRGATGANRIASLAGFASNTAGTADAVLPGLGGVVRDYQALAVTGAASDGGGAMSGLSIAVAGAPADLTLSAPVSAGGTVKLQATGNVRGSGAGTVSAATLTAQAGVIPDTEAGGAAPGALPVGAQVASLADVSLTGANAVQTLGPLSATGNVTIYDGPSVATLTVAGPVLAGAGPGTATVTADIEATNAMLVTGAVQAGIAQPGYAAGNVRLLAGVDAATGNAGAGALLIDGNVSATGSGVSGQAITLAAGTSRALDMTANGTASTISIMGTVDGTDRVSGGAPRVAASLTLVAGGRIVENGIVRAAKLSGAAGYSIDLRGTPGANVIDTLGALASNRAGTPDQVLPGAGLLLRTYTPLTVAGPVQDLGGAGSGVSLVVAGSPADLTLLGGVTAVGGTVTLQATGNIVEGAGGAITAATLTGQAGMTPDSDGGPAPGTAPDAAPQSFASIADATLNNDNAVGALGPFDTTGSLILRNRASLAVTGPVVAGSARGPGDASVALSLPDATSTLSVPGTITAPQVALSSGGGIVETGALAAGRLTVGAGGAASFAGANRIGALGAANAGTSFLLATGPSLTVDGTVTAGTDATVAVAAGTLTVTGGITVGRDLALSASGDVVLPGSVAAGRTLTTVAGGAIAQTGTARAATLAGSSGAAATFSGANAIAAISTFSAGGPFALRDATGLALTGTLASAAAGTLAQPSLSLVVAGGITVQRGATVLTSSPSGVATLSTTGGDIAIDGTLAAPLLVVSAPGRAITLGDGSAIRTGTKNPPRPIGNLANGQPFPTPSTSQGAFFSASSFTQTGLATVNGGPAQGNGRIDATVRIDLDSAGGRIAFGNLQGATTQLYLVLNGGSASGAVTVGGLNIDSGATTSQTPGAGAVSLTGTVAGRGGTTAAGVAYLDPQRNARFSINNCAIQSVNCVLLSPLVVPVTNPTQDISLGTDRRRRDDTDLILPNVGEQDF